jgi:hypothetical protein
MSNIGSTNTKVALAFAGMTILGTLLMVGTPGNEGVLGQITSRLSEQTSDADAESGAVIEEPSVSKSVSAPVSVWDSPITEISDSDVPPERTVIEAPKPGFAPAFAPAPPANDGDPAKAPLSPGAITSDDYGED